MIKHLDNYKPKYINGVHIHDVRLKSLDFKQKELELLEKNTVLPVDEKNKQITKLLCKINNLSRLINLHTLTDGSTIEKPSLRLINMTKEDLSLSNNK